MTFWNDPIASIGDWLTGLMTGWNFSPALISVIMDVIGGLIVSVAGLVLLIFLIWVERKIAARFQDRIGPNRAGPYGLLQTFADLLKLITKEMILPENVDKALYNIAPVISFGSVIAILGVLPFSANWMGTDLNVGALYIAAVGSFGILSILLAGWSSNNKYSLLGAFRSGAQLISYEVPMLLSLLIPVLLAHSMNIGTIVEQQKVWFILMVPASALLFFLSSMAEIGRAPFDLIEADSEIVAGYVTEYSGMKFAMFFAGEYLHAYVVGIIFAVLFLGGWRGPWAEDYQVLGVFYLLIKSSAAYFVVLWLRNSLPRFRVDQMMALNWKVFTPMALLLLMGTAIVEKLFYADGAVSVPMIIGLLAVNIVVVLLTILGLNTSYKGRIVEREEFDKRPVAVPPADETPASA